MRHTGRLQLLFKVLMHLARHLRVGPAEQPSTGTRMLDPKSRGSTADTPIAPNTQPWPIGLLGSSSHACWR
jgi:hypothetical protein